MTLVESPYSVRSRLCDSWTKSDDDKVETSRMGNNNDEVIKVNNSDEVDMIEVKMNPSGHKPCVLDTGTAYSTRPHRNLEGDRQEMMCGIQEDQDALLGHTTTVLYTFMRQL